MAAGGGRPLLPEIYGQTGPVGAKSPIFRLFARSASAVTPSEKVQLPLIGSLLRRSKIALCLKKVCYKVSLCENCQQQSCEAFIGLTIRAKSDWWGTSTSTRKFGWNWTTPRDQQPRPTERISLQGSDLRSQTFRDKFSSQSEPPARESECQSYGFSKEIPGTSYLYRNDYVQYTIYNDAN